MWKAVAVRSKVGLVWIEEAREGSAPCYHLRGTVARLHASGVAASSIKVVSWSGHRNARRLGLLLVRAALIGFRVRNVVARWHPVLLPFVLIWRLMGCRVTLLIQGTYDDAIAAHPVYGRSWLLKWASINSVRFGHTAIAAHVGIADWASKIRGDEVPVLPNGAPILGPDPSGMDPLPRLPGAYVVFAGALASWQGIEVMLDAVNHHNWPDGVDLIVIGDGHLRGVVESRAVGTVHYLGRREPHQVRMVIRGAVASLSPKLLNDVTRRGISPFKLIEAGCESTMIIATRVPGQTEYVEHFQCGLLIEPGDVSELAAAVAHAAANPQAAAVMGGNGLLAAGESAWERQADVLAKVLR